MDSLLVFGPGEDKPRNAPLPTVDTAILEWVQADPKAGVPRGHWLLTWHPAGWPDRNETHYPFYGPPDAAWAANKARRILAGDEPADDWPLADQSVLPKDGRDGRTEDRA